MRVGSVCYATSRGLGHIAKGFHDHGIVTDVCVVRHPSIPTHEDWYPGALSTGMRPLDTKLLRDFAAKQEALLFFETPFLWELFGYCKHRGIRTYLVPMYECHHASAPAPHKYLCPSLLDMEYFPSGDFLPLPVEVPWRLRERAETFVHNGGYLGLRGREGTTLLIEAMRYVKSPLRLIIRVQENVDGAHQQMMAKDPRIDYRPECVPFADLWSEGDVYVAPQKFNGCSMPLQEACAAGLLVMTTNRFPMNTWLPTEPLLPVSGYRRDVQVGGPYLKFDEAIVSPEAIAQTMDAWYGRDIAEFSLRGKVWAEAHSWEVLGPKWREALKV